MAQVFVWSFVFLFFVVLDKILERVLPVKNRTNEQYHQIQHIRFKLGTNFYTHIFDQIWIKFAKKNGNFVPKQKR